MKVLVLAQSYPDNNGCVELNYIHTRNMYYRDSGIDVTVLNFKANSCYKKDDIEVITLDNYRVKKEKYDLLIIHAANIRNHYRFLKEYGDDFPRFLFFYHGHEVMRINHDYAKPYAYMTENCFRYVMQDIYDCYKLSVWKKYIPTVLHKSHFIFVSKWMRDTFVRNIGIPVEKLQGKSSITYNSIGKDFETLQYDSSCNKEYDFVTVRANLDGSKYAIDIVNRLAMNTPSAKFLVIGKGEFFKHYKKADNLTWMDTTMNHSEIVQVLNNSRFALMPTRTDAQGLMMCEMAAFGIPVITSDIPVCHEVFDGFSNAFYISNDSTTESLSNFLGKECDSIKDDRYYKAKTIDHELEVIRLSVGES